MSHARVALVCSVVSVACAPAELSGSDRLEGGIADSSTSCRHAASASDFYVAPAAGADCNFSTISAALQAARSSTAGERTVHLGGAVYSDSTDFPIDLRGGISLEGTGDSGEHMTTLQGVGFTTSVGAPSNGYAQLSSAVAVYAAILVGDPVKTSRVSGLSMAPAAGPAPGTEGAPGSEAIACESGNAMTVPPSPNTLVSQVAISGFEVGVRVTWSKSPLSGCNLSLTSSVVRDGSYGVVADGYELAGKPVQTVSARIGDLTGGGNQFINLDVQSNGALRYAGSGLATGDAVTGVVVEGNHFFQENSRLCDSAIWAVPGSPSELPGFDIEGNDFGPLTNLGVELAGPVVVDRLIDNSFHDISMVGRNWAGVGLAIGGELVETHLPFPVVRRARGNKFIGNDIGVAIRSNVNWATPLAQDGLSTDFGTAADPGNNIFRCNSTPPDLVAGNLTGFDLFIQFSTPPPAGPPIPFEGNVWDHAPPTAIAAPDAPAGADIFLQTDGGAPPEPRLDVADAAAASIPACPNGRVAGP
jgi:hypothetical protein